MSETWTEYAVHWRDFDFDAYSDPFVTRQAAQSLADENPEWEPIVVGRTVTASDWLPVDTDGAK